MAGIPAAYKRSGRTIPQKHHKRRDRVLKGTVDWLRVGCAWKEGITSQRNFFSLMGKKSIGVYSVSKGKRDINQVNVIQITMIPDFFTSFST